MPHVVREENQIESHLLYQLENPLVNQSEKWL